MTKETLLGLSVVAIACAIWLGIRLSMKGAHAALAENRKAWSGFEESGRLPSPVLDWLIAHVRDDLAGIWVMLVIMNGLLAGILAAVTANLFR